jgi:DNA helicase II / ATP-dependent DNA helicase PcrA
VDDLSRPRQAAERTLRWWSAQRRQGASGVESDAVPTDIATDIDALLVRLALEVAPFHPESRARGALGWLEPGEDLIFIRDDLAEPVRRFTLAHELGHALLHRADGAARLPDDAGAPAPWGALPEDDEAAAADLCDDADLDLTAESAALGEETLGAGQAYSARARREHEANVFAAALLLPPDRLRTLYLGVDGAAGLAPRALAQAFAVSEEAVHQGLAALLSEPTPASAAPPTASATRAASPALDPSQRRATAAATPALVVAGPGTGKTSTLVGRVAYLANERGVAPASILALTFSNKAAREMRERLAALLAGREGDGTPAVGTIHAFCGDLLRRYGPLVGLRPDYRLMTEAEGYLLLREITADLALGHYQPLAAPAMHFPALLGAISRAKDELTDPERYAALAEDMRAAAATEDARREAQRAAEVARVYAAYQRALEDAGNADFGDLIRLAVRLLREQPAVVRDLRARYAHVLVDEFQDINYAMGVLLAVLVGPKGPIWAVGDADQAIYRFRGASPENLTRFSETYRGAHIYALGTNYRSRQPILRAAAAVADAFLTQRQRAVLAAAYQPAVPPSPSVGGKGPGGRWEGAALTVAVAPTQAAELAGLVERIRAAAACGYALADQAVLCRTRRQCQQVAAALESAGLRARLSTPLLEDDAVKDVLGVLGLLADASGTGLLRAGNVANHAFTRGAARSVLREARERHVPPLALLNDPAALEALGDLTPADVTGLTHLAAILPGLRAAPDAATGLARYLFAATALGRQALADATPEGRQRASRLARLLALARTYEDQRRDRTPAGGRRHTATADWAAFLDYVRVLVALGRDVGAEDAGGELTVDSVRVLTVHASKGLEFPIVYLPGMANGRFPTQRRGETTPPPPGLSGDDAAEPRDAAGTHLIEEACLFYVAITRARDALVLSRAERYGQRAAAPSPFLAPLVGLGSEAGPDVTQQRWAAAPPAAVAAAAHNADPTHDAEPPLPGGEPLRQSELDAYQRCPRQYAYRYVYHLRPREVGLGTLRRSLDDTMRELQSAVAGADDPDAPRSLDDAMALFERHWHAAVAAEAAHRDPPAGDGPSDEEGPFGALYRRYGRRVVERAWHDLAEAPRQPVLVDAAAEPDGDASAPEVAEGDRAPHAAPLPRTAKLSERVQIRVGGHPIEVTLDRIDGASEQAGRAHAAGAGGDAAGPAHADAASAREERARYVRHRIGQRATANAQADLRTYLYALAAEQHHGPVRPTLFQHDLATGVLEPVGLDPKRAGRLRDSLLETLNDMEHGEYPARPDPLTCSTCPFLLICPA